MSPASQTALKHLVAAGMRGLREQRGVTRDEAASVIHSSVQNVGHIETGRSLPNGLQLEKLLAHYGAPDLIPKYLDLRDRAKRSADWWTRLPGPVPEYQTLFLGCESMADRIETWDPLQIPDLAQTPDYAHTLLTATTPNHEETKVEARIALLAARQRAVLDDAPPSLSLLLTQAALRWPSAPAAVAKTQARHLLNLSARPEVEVRVVPPDAPRRPPAGGAFTVLSFPGVAEDLGAAYTETLVSGYYYETPTEVSHYRTTLTSLRDAALSPEDTQALLRRASR